MRIGRRQIVWTTLGLAAVLAVAALLRPAPVEVSTGVVKRDVLRVTIDEEGETRLRRRFVVSAPVSGRVLRIEAVAGQNVKQGQTLATITPARPSPLDARTRAAADARVRTAEAELERARSERRRLAVEAEQAARESERTANLFKGGSVAREAAEVARTRAESATAAVAAGDAAIRAAEFALTEARAALISSGGDPASRAVAVTAPVDGVVLRRLQESESVVAAGAPFLEIGDLRDLEVVTDLLSRDAVRVRPGAAAVITDWGGTRDLAGRVLRVEPSGFTKVSALGVEEQRVNVIVEIVDPPSARESLGDAFRVEVRIVMSERQDVLTVPAAALFRVEGRWTVFVVANGELAQHDVQIGERNEHAAEVVSGLADGDRVVVYPGESLATGMRVIAR